MSNLKSPKCIKIKIFKIDFILDYFKFKLGTCWAQSDVFGAKSKGFSKIRQIRLFRQGISENLDYNLRFVFIFSQGSKVIAEQQLNYTELKPFKIMHLQIHDPFF